MKIHHQHPWDLSPRQAIQLQKDLQGYVITQDRLGPVRSVAGADVGFEANKRITRAAVVRLSFPELDVLEHTIVRMPTQFPYVPGLLSFREIPAVIEALGKLRQLPDLILCDGQGLAHPRRFGLACHLGLLTDIATIGVAKTRFIGQHEPVADERGASTPLLDGGEVIGAVLRTRAKVKPLYVSVGHKISLASALDYVLACAPRYRLPETTRLADRLASRRGPIPKRK